MGVPAEKDRKVSVDGSYEIASLIEILQTDLAHHFQLLEHPYIIDRLRRFQQSVMLETAMPPLQQRPPVQFARLLNVQATPAQVEKEEPAAPAVEKHRGSDIVEAPSDEIKKIESETSLKEEDNEDEATMEATEGVEGLKVADETAKPQEQSAGGGEAAGESVED